MSFLNLPWQWDKTEAIDQPAKFSVIRWRRGPVTFYKYVLFFEQDENPEIQYWICVADDVSFGIHLPWFK